MEYRDIVSWHGLDREASHDLAVRIGSERASCPPKRSRKVRYVLYVEHDAAVIAVHSDRRCSMRARRYEQRVQSHDHSVMNLVQSARCNNSGEAVAALRRNEAMIMLRKTECVGQCRQKSKCDEMIAAR